MSMSAQVEQDEQDTEYELWCAVVEERQAYAAMRFLVPTCHCPSPSAAR